MEVHFYIFSPAHLISVKVETITIVDIIFIEVKGKFISGKVGMLCRPPLQSVEVGHVLSESVFEISCRFEILTMETSTSR